MLVGLFVHPAEKVDPCVEVAARSELCLQRILGAESSALGAGGDVHLGGVAVFEGWCHRDGARGGRAVDIEDGHPG